MGRGGMGKDDRHKKDRREEKMEKKLTESREEKMLRRLEKKKRKREQEEASKTICGYTNENNRFGDSNLTSGFVWHKKGKAEDQASSYMSEAQKRRIETERKAKIEDEVEKVKRRREEREKEQAWMEEEKARMARESEEMQHNEWEARADEFHLEQARLRAKIRSAEGRAKPIDVLAKNLMGDDMDIEITEPYKLFKNLTLPALEELLGDIHHHQALDKDNGEFWDALVVVCHDEIQAAKQRAEREKQGKGGVGMEGGVHSAILQDIVAEFSGKSLAELLKQEDELKDGEAGLDPEFLESVLAQIKIAQAKAKLREIHAKILRKRLAALEGELAEEAMAYAPMPKEPKEKESEWDKPEEKMEEPDSDDENAGSYSPVLDQEYRGEDAIDAEADKRAIEQQRKAILDAEAQKFASAAAKNAAHGIIPDKDLQWVQAEAARGLGEDEAIFNTEVDLDQQVYSWHDKYRPRKPRFFNRVHTGYEWNKYNQTHYDHDNPPPKIVQGYKFNIFYPDLIDKSKAPTFRLENDKTPDTKIVRFIAGPPYEDVAFRIVNKEWEFSHKKGFKCTFDRGILHLYFNFMRYRYRR